MCNSTDILQPSISLYFFQLYLTLIVKSITSVVDMESRHQVVKYLPSISFQIGDILSSLLFSMTRICGSLKMPPTIFASVKLENSFFMYYRAANALFSAVANYFTNPSLMCSVGMTTFSLGTKAVLITLCFPGIISVHSDHTVCS